MSIIDRTSLEASPLADLHTIASELGIDGYRRLRRPQLIQAILDKQAGSAEGDGPPTIQAEADGGPTIQAQAATSMPEAESESEAPDSEKEPDDEAAQAERTGARRRRGRRGGRGRGAARDEDEAAPSGALSTDTESEARAEVDGRREAEGPDGAADKAGAAVADEPEAEESGQEPVVDGVVELLAGGSGFVRVDPPDPSDDDVYISSPQVKRCELVTGDRVSGPKRAPRRSERFASLIKIETINGRPASEQADGIRYDDLPAAFPSDQLKLGSEDPTLKAIESLTPFGKGSRVSIVGPSRSGKTETLRRVAHALVERDDLAVTVVLAGVRPEETFEWAAGVVAPAAAVSLAASEDAQNAAIEPAIDQARRLATRGTDAVVLIDSLDGCSPSVARKALAGARNIVDGGSLTVIATASAPVGGETTVIALDAKLAGAGRFPALDLTASGALRPELLVGEAGADAIARTRLEAITGRDSWRRRGGSSQAPPPG